MANINEIQTFYTNAIINNLNIIKANNDLKIKDFSEEILKCKDYNNYEVKLNNDWSSTVFYSVWNEKKEKILLDIDALNLFLDEIESELKKKITTTEQKINKIEVENVLLQKIITLKNFSFSVLYAHGRTNLDFESSDNSIKKFLNSKSKLLTSNLDWKTELKVEDNSIVYNEFDNLITKLPLQEEIDKETNDYSLIDSEILFYEDLAKKNEVDDFNIQNETWIIIESELIFWTNNTNTSVNLENTDIDDITSDNMEQSNQNNTLDELNFNDISFDNSSESLEIINNDIIEIDNTNKMLLSKEEEDVLTFVDDVFNDVSSKNIEGVENVEGVRNEISFDDVFLELNSLDYSTSDLETNNFVEDIKTNTNESDNKRSFDNDETKIEIEKKSNNDDNLKLEEANYALEFNKLKPWVSNNEKEIDNTENITSNIIDDNISFEDDFLWLNSISTNYNDNISKNTNNEIKIVKNDIDDDFLWLNNDNQIDTLNDLMSTDNNLQNDIINNIINESQVENSPLANLNVEVIEPIKKVKNEESQIVTTQFQQWLLQPIIVQMPNQSWTTKIIERVVERYTDNNSQNNQNDILAQLEDISLEEIPEMNLSTTDKEKLKRTKEALDFISKTKSIKTKVLPNKEFKVRNEWFFDKFSGREKIFAIISIFIIFFWSIAWILSANSVSGVKMEFLTKETNFTNEIARLKTQVKFLEGEKEELIWKEKDKKEKESPILWSAKNLSLAMIDKIKVDEESDPKMTTNVIKNKYLVIKLPSLKPETGKKLSIVLTNGESIDYIIKRSIIGTTDGIPQIIENIEKELIDKPDEQKYFVLVWWENKQYYIAQP